MFGVFFPAKVESVKWRNLKVFETIGLGGIEVKVDKPIDAPAGIIVDKALIDDFNSRENTQLKNFELHLLFWSDTVG